MPLIFSQQELVALTMALSEVPEAVTDGQARSAVAKVLGALPGRVAGPAQAVLDAPTSQPDASGGPASPPPNSPCSTSYGTW